jgi:hypothetical protein
MIQSDINPAIRIDAEGIWYFHGEEMKRQDIVRYFYHHLKIDSVGNYLIEIENDRCPVSVEDAPYVIKSVSVSSSRNDGKLCIELSLSDGSCEELNDDTPLWTRDDNLMYCRVKKGQYTARFSRSAYYQLCENAEYDQAKEQYFINLIDRSYPIESFQQTINGGSNVR